MSKTKSVSNEAVARLSQVSLGFKVYDRKYRRLYGSLDLELKKGKTVVLLGPNGSGKSSLFKILLGQIPPDSGNVFLDCPVSKLGYIPQDYRKALFPWLSMKKHLELFSRGLNEFDINYFEQISSAFSLAADRHIPISKNSGGEQQLFLLSLVLSRKADIYLMDEPFSAIDLKRRLNAVKLLSQHLVSAKIPALIVTHNIEEASYLADEVIILSGSHNVDPLVLENNGDEDFHTKLRQAYSDISG